MSRGNSSYGVFTNPRLSIEQIREKDSRNVPLTWSELMRLGNERRNTHLYRMHPGARKACIRAINHKLSDPRFPRPVSVPVCDVVMSTRSLDTTRTSSRSSTRPVTVSDTQRCCNTTNMLECVVC